MSNAHANIRKWRSDPVSFVRSQFNTEPDLWQARALRAFAEKDERVMRISLQACAGPGKSAVLAWIGWNFLSCYGRPGEHPKGAAVSVTESNLKDNLWAEMSKWQNRSKFLQQAFKWQKSRIYAVDHPETWFLSARSWSKSANADEQGRTLSGIHSEFVLFLIDESGEIPLSVLKATEQALGGCEFGRVIQAGNPTSHDGMLYAASTILAAKWTVIKITGDPDDPERSPRIDAGWAREQIKLYGRKDPWVMSYILGEFPDVAINTLLSLAEVEEAMKRGCTQDHYVQAQKRLGIDVARFGQDSTAIFPRQGLRAFKPVIMRGARSDEIAARVLLSKQKWDSELEFVDGSGGYGSGVVDSLLQAGASPHEISFSSKPINPRYYNKRAEMWFNMAEWIKKGGILPDDPDLKKELTVPTYSFRDGRFIMEAKEQIVKRMGFSPDKADALALTFALPDMPGKGSAHSIRERYVNQNKFKEYDPYKDDGGYQDNYNPFL